MDTKTENFLEVYHNELPTYVYMIGYEGVLNYLTIRAREAYASGDIKLCEAINQLEKELKAKQLANG